MQTTMYEELVRGLLSIFSNQTVQIVLYGSTARKTASEDSDIDVAIFLTRKIDPRQEDLLSDFVVDMNLKFDKVFSVIDIENQLFQRLENISPFYKNVNKEGIVLWKAA